MLTMLFDRESVTATDSPFTNAAAVPGSTSTASGAFGLLEDGMVVVERTVVDVAPEEEGPTNVFVGATVVETED